MRKVLTFILVTVLLTACSLTKDKGPQVNIEASAGQEFKVIVESNPSTGYHWEMVGDLDPNIVEFVSRDYRANEPVQPGSGGSDIFIFKAVNAGETTITLGSFPPGNNATKPGQTKTFTIVVK